MSTVVMTNPSLPGGERAVTTQEAFDEVHEAKGWVLVTDEPAAEEPAPEPEKAVDAPKSKPAQAPLTATKAGA